MMRALLAMALTVLAGCGSSPEPAAQPAAPPAAAPARVKDLTGLLPPAGQVSAKVVPDHILGEPKMPGGTVGDYAVGNKKYQLFIVESDNAQNAALMLLDMKGVLKIPSICRTSAAISEPWERSRYSFSPSSSTWPAWWGCRRRMPSRSPECWPRDCDNVQWTGGSACPTSFL